MKKLLGIVFLGLLLSTKAFAYKSIKILDKIDLTVDADIQTVLTSIKDYNSNTNCEIRVTKKGDYVPTSVRFSVNDNLNDLIIANKGYFDNGNYNSSISIFENIGTIENPIFNFVTDDFANISTVLGILPSVQALHPTFGDINNDGNIDMIIGDNNGELYLFKNDGSILSEWPTFLDYELLNIDVGSFAAPQLIDLNRDGLLDLVIGERMGIDNGVYNGINYYQNIGSLTNPEFEDYTPVLASGELDENQNEIMVKSLGGIHLADPTYLTAYTAPQIFETNNEFHLAIGTEQGKVFLYDNLELVDNNTSTTILNLESEFNLITDDLLSNTNSIHSKIAIQDLNNDNLPDVIRGNASGGLELFLANSFNISSLNTNLEKIEIFPNPNNGNFNIKLPLNNNGTLTIFSILGKIILNKKITSNKEIYQISNIKSGIYIVSIKTENQTYTKKIVVNN
ncbi:MAG: T9SS C-terminal target domain-containing protein [Flavobacteriales bacterium TMED191]|nr:MAG: T9SS C-terminal target domain-containing protein [Flavobacteriales bacterium TMED191]